jgi:AraC-like DNA-binding protein
MLRRIFDDPDEFRGRLGGVSCDMWITGVKKRQWAYESIRLGDLTLQQGELGSGNLVNCQTSPHGTLAYILVSSTGSSRLNGREIGDGSGALFHPNQDFTLSHSHPHHWLSLFIPATVWLPAWTPSPSGIQLETCAVSNASTHAWLAHRIAGACSEIFMAARKVHAFEASPAAQRAGAHLLRLLQAVPSQGQAREGSGGRGRPAIPRSAVMAACHRYLAAAEPDTVSLPELVGHSGVSDRTLRAIFHEYYGFGPGRFLQLRQLHCVHRDLRTADPDITQVSEVLTRHGVWNFSHFGRRYKKLFGQTPSRTLRTPERILVACGSG